MTSSYTQATWRRAYAELLTELAGIGIPEEVGRYIAQNLRSERGIRRMISYLRNVRPTSMEDIADELLAIMEDQARWRSKKEAEESSARYNAWLRSDLRPTDD